MPIRTNINNNHNSVLPFGGKVCTGYTSGVKTVDQSISRLERTVHRVHRADTSNMNHYSPDDRSRGTRTAGYHDFHKQGTNGWLKENSCLSPSHSYVPDTCGSPTFSPKRQSAIKSTYTSKTTKHVTMFDPEPASRDLRKPGLHRRADQTTNNIFCSPVDNRSLSSAIIRSRSAPVAPYAVGESQASVQSFRGLRIINPKFSGCDSPTGIAIKRDKPLSLVGVLSLDPVKPACPPPASPTPFATSFLGRHEGARDALRTGGKGVVGIPNACSIFQEPAPRGLGRTAAPATRELSWKSSISCTPVSSIHRSARGTSRLEGLGHIVTASTERGRPQGLRSAAYRSKSADFLVWA